MKIGTLVECPHCHIIEPLNYSYCCEHCGREIVKMNINIPQESIIIKSER